MCEATPAPAPSWDVTLPDFAQAASFSPDGAIVGAATLAGPVLFLDAHSAEVLSTNAGHEGGALSLAFSPDGRWVATGGQDGQVEVTDVATRASFRLHAPGGWVAHVAWSPDGQILAAASGATVRFYATTTWQTLGDSIEHASSVTALVPLGDASWVTACYGGLQCVEPGTRRATAHYRFRGSVIAASPSPDGSMIALGSQDAAVRVWDRRTRNDAHLTGYRSKVVALAWGGREPLLATGGGNEAIVWDCSGHGPRGTTPAKLTGHTGRVTALTFAGDTLVTAALDGRIGVWRRDAAWQAASWRQTRGPVHMLAQHGSHVVASSAGGYLSAWSL